MRRVRFVSAVAPVSAVVLSTLCVAVLAPGAPGYAAPSPSPAVSAAPATATAGQPVCTINAKGVNGLSGMVATSTGFTVINDSQTVKSDIKIFYLDNACKIKSSVSYPSDALDPEDLAAAADGTLWIGDIGDTPPANGGTKRRETIALWSLSPGTSQKPVIHRFTYPDPPHDAEALLINGDGVPIIITKQVESGKIGSAAGIYMPEGQVQNNNTVGVKLKRVGEFKPPTTGTANPLAAIGQSLITGAATSPDRKKVVLRTYADAFEWDVPDGDVVKAITTGKPRVTPLPNEQWGEAITYSTDGKFFFTVGDNDLAGTQTSTILRYTPVVQTAPSKAADKPASGKEKSWRDELTLQDLTYAVAAVGGLGLILVIVGVVGIHKSRQARRKAARTQSGSVRGSASVGSATAGAQPADRYDDPVDDAWGDYDYDQGQGPPVGGSGGRGGAAGHGRGGPRAEGHGGERRGGGGGTVYGRSGNARDSDPPHATSYRRDQYRGDPGGGDQRLDYAGRGHRDDEYGANGGSGGGWR